MSDAGLWRVALEWAERGALPDVLLRWGIRRLTADGLRARRAASAEQEHERFRELLALLRSSPIAIETQAANAQHYAIPPEFFQLVLGEHLKYSGCYWDAGVTTLEQAEAAALTQVCQRAAIQDGQGVLELGCGWGALTLWIARHYPRCQIVGVSNSAAQRQFIEQRCRTLRLPNVRIITADMNQFDSLERFDRVVSIEMFEHMRNYELLLRRIATWLRPAGRLFVHIFTHARGAYLFELGGPADWMSRYFFTGGIMPSDDLLAHFQDDLLLEEHWRQGGEHYQRTANAWLQNLDARRDDALRALTPVYGQADAARWLNRWRLFFMACAEMFGYESGRVWGVSHYRFRPRNSVS